MMKFLKNLFNKEKKVELPQSYDNKDATNSEKQVPNIKLLEITKKEIVRTGSPWDWQEGYPEEQYKNMECLDGGIYFEDEKRINLKTTNNFKYGYLKEGFLHERTREYLIYWTLGSEVIKKHIDGSNIIEVTDRVGNKCKIKVDALYVDKNFNHQCFYTQIFSKDLLELFCAGLRADFLPNNFGNAYIERTEKGFKIYFDFVSILQNTINRYYNNGTLAQSDGYPSWLKIRELLNSCIKETNISIDKLESLNKFNYRNF